MPSLLIVDDEPNVLYSLKPGLEADDVRVLVRALIRSGSDDLYRQVISAVDEVVLDEVLGHLKGNQVHASELLGLSRIALRAKLATPDMSGGG